MKNENDIVKCKLCNNLTDKYNEYCNGCRKQEVREELIEKVSILLRNEYDVSNSLENEIKEIKNKLKDKSISYHDYIGLERRLVMTNQEYDVQLFITKGIALAREALFAE